MHLGGGGGGGPGCAFMNCSCMHFEKASQGVNNVIRIPWQLQSCTAPELQSLPTWSTFKLTSSRLGKSHNDGPTWKAAASCALVFSVARVAPESGTHPENTGKSRFWKSPRRKWPPKKQRKTRTPRDPSWVNLPVGTSFAGGARKLFFLRNPRTHVHGCAAPEKAPFFFFAGLLIEANGLGVPWGPSRWCAMSVHRLMVRTHTQEPLHVINPELPEESFARQRFVRLPSASKRVRHNRERVPWQSSLPRERR